MPASPSSSLRATLRRATEDLHTSLDQLVLHAEPFRTPERYRQFLECHYAARARVLGLFGSLAPPGDAEGFARLTQRALTSDLSMLGSETSVDAHWSPHGGESSLGVMYVLEGSLLGGRLLAASLGTALGTGAPRSFLESGATPPKRWSRVLDVLTSFTGDHDEVVNAARTTFALHLDAFGELAR